MDKVERVYEAIDQIALAHGTSRPEKFGGGNWDFDEEIKIWKKQIIGHETIPLTSLQWAIIDSYIKSKKEELKI